MSIFQPDSRSLELIWYFDTPASAVLKQTVSAPCAPFNSGTWTFSYDPSSSYVSLKCENVVQSIRITSATLMTTSLPWTSGWDRSSGVVLSNSDFPPQKDGRWSCEIYSYTSTYRRVARLQLELAAPLPKCALEDSQAGMVARRNAINFASQAPNDVVFYFPRSKRELWATSQALVQASPYFTSLLEGGFKESEGTVEEGEDAVKPNTDGLESDGHLDLSADSDDESDQIPLKLAATRTKSCPSGAKEVIITDHTYTTYHALFAWLYFDHIDFAPLSPPPFVPKPEGGDLNPRQAHIHAAAKAKPNLPLPASPKSVYKLAQLVELPRLAALALANLKSQLTIDNVLYELTTDIAFHDEACKVIEDFAVTNWTAVKQAPVALELEKGEVLNALPNPTEAGARLFKLARRC